MEEFLSTAAIGASAVASIFIINVIFKKLAGGFQRDAVKNSFADPIVGSMSLLNNDDSVLTRDGVQGSIEGYEQLFTGARKAVGSTSKGDSINVREKEYKTMVNSFYDLVTDFYEWGWGQVRRQDFPYLKFNFVGSHSEMYLV